MAEETYSERISREDELVKEMEEKLGQPWETAVLDLVNAPAAHALDHLWREIIYAQHGEEYGDWEYPGQAYRHLKAEYDELRAENYRLREQLRKAHISTFARPFLDSDLDCEGDGSGPGCEKDVAWEIQATDASGSHYSYVCSEHLDSYQKWAAEDGRQPLVFAVD